MLSQNRTVEQILRFKKQFLQLDQPEIVNLLEADYLLLALEQAEEKIHHPLRERIWLPMLTLSAFVKQTLIHGGCIDAVSFVQAERARTGLEPCSNSTSAYCQARQQLPESLFWDLLRHTGRQLENESQAHWRWRGRVVKFADGSTVSMSDTPANQAVYPQESNQREGLGFPLARIEIITSLNGGAVLDCAVGTYAGKCAGESALLRRMMSANFQAGDICMTDRYYESFWFEASLLEQGVDLLCPVRGNRKINWMDGIQLRKDYYDRLFELKKPARRPEWMTPEAYNKLPESITVRIFRIYGRNYATTLLDPKRYRKNALRKLYQQRWQIEVDLRFIKQVMKMEFLRCKTPEMVRKEIAVTLLTYNLVRMLMAQAGIRHGVWPRSLSFGKALSTLREFATDLLMATGKVLLELANKVLKIVASAKLYKRKGRAEPREIKRRHTKRYPYQNTPRTARNAKTDTKQNSYRDWFRGISRDAKCVPT